MPYKYSDLLDDPILLERCESFRGGMDAFNRATLLPADVSQYLQNIIVDDNNVAMTRPGADALGAVAAGANGIQGMAYYDTPNDEQLLAAKNQNLEKWEGASWATVDTGIFTSAEALVEMMQGGDKLYISDGTNQWWSWDGTSLTASLGSVSAGPSGDPPVGATMMAWHTNRMFASGSASEPDALWASDFLNAGTGKWNHTDFKIRIGGGEGQPIKCILPFVDHYLAVLKDESIYVVNADPTAGTAADWTISKLTSGIGCVSRRGAVQVGNDILFMARDGIRSLRRSDGLSNTFEIAIPLSEPLQPYIDRINWSAASKICAHKYRHYAFFAVPLDSATSPDYVFVWNERMRSWMGVWTNWTPTIFATTLFSDVRELVIGDSVGRVNKWKDADDITLDATVQDNSGYYTTQITTRAVVFEEFVSEKDGDFYEVRFVNTDNEVDLKPYYDEIDVDMKTVTVNTAANQLPVDLPFDLAKLSPYTARISLSHLGKFNEVYLDISTSVGGIQVKNWSIAAFLDTVINE